MKKYLFGLLATALLAGGYIAYADTLNDIQVMVHNGTTFVPFNMTPTNGLYDSALVYDKDAEIYRMGELNTSQFDVESGILSIKSSYTNSFVSTSSIASITTTMAEISSNLAGGDSTMLAGNSSAPNRGLVTAAERAAIASIISPVQVDWNVTSTTSLAYIKNKPTIKRVETSSGTTNGSGVYTVTFGTNFAVAPNVQANVINGSDTQTIRITSVSSSSVSVLVRNRTDVLGLLPSYSNVSGAAVDVLVTEK